MPRLVKVPPATPILVVTDPPEPLIDVTRHLPGHDRVFGTSTYLDSLRFRVHLAGRFGVSPACVEADVVDEHGTSSVFLWSSARIGGAPVTNLALRRPLTFIVLAIFILISGVLCIISDAKGYFSEYRHPGRFGDF